MLNEIHSVSQISDEPRRRWFADDSFDLIVRFNDDGAIFGFQLSYDKDRNQRAVTWKREKGFAHHRVDDGENRPGRYKATPILVADRVFDFKRVAERFRRDSALIHSEIADLVYERLLMYKGK